MRHNMDIRQLINSRAVLTLIKGHVMLVRHTLYIYRDGHRENLWIWSYVFIIHTGFVDLSGYEDSLLLDLFCLVIVEDYVVRYIFLMKWLLKIM